MDNDMDAHVKPVKVVTRKINRGANPYAPLATIRNEELSSAVKYETAESRMLLIVNDDTIKEAIKERKKHLGNDTYKQLHFGRLAYVSPLVCDYEVGLQRQAEVAHIGKNIVALFDPRIMQPICATFIKETGRYSVWEGQQRLTAVLLMQHHGLVSRDVLVPCMVFDDDLSIPGSPNTGNAVGNYAFRRINGKGQKKPDPFYTFRSEVNGVRLYNSKLTEDLHSEAIQQVVEKHNMYTSPSNYPRAPGMITHVSALRLMARHNTQYPAVFVKGLAAVDWALGWHNKYYSSELGVNSGFIIAFSTLAAEAAENGFTITPELEEDLFRHMTKEYGHPSGFARNCKQVLKNWQKMNHIKEVWASSALLPLLMHGYVTDPDRKCKVFVVNGFNLYAGIDTRLPEDSKVAKLSHQKTRQAKVLNVNIKDSLTQDLFSDSELEDYEDLAIEELV
jgi:hypothetical protein